MADFGRFSLKVVIFTDIFINSEKKALILQHTFETYTFGASEIDTPIEDPKLDGRFVERIRRSDRESSIDRGVQKSGLFRTPGGLENRQDPYSGQAVWGKSTRSVNYF